MRTVMLSYKCALSCVEAKVKSLFSDWRCPIERILFLLILSLATEIRGMLE